MSSTPASAAASAASMTSARAAESIVAGAGWRSSQRRKIRTVSSPCLAMRRKSRRTATPS